LKGKRILLFPRKAIRLGGREGTASGQFSHVGQVRGGEADKTPYERKKILETWDRHRDKAKRGQTSVERGWGTQLFLKTKSGSPAGPQNRGAHRLTGYY